MIHVALAAQMECIEPKCGATLDVKLALSAGGTLMPRIPHGHGWQIGVVENGCMVCRCPRHHSLVETVKPRLVEAKH